MLHSNPNLPPTATLDHARLLQLANPTLHAIVSIVADFMTQPVTPQATYQLELRIQQQLRELGRQTLQFAFNHLEPDDPKLQPQRLRYHGQTYRRKRKTPRKIDTLFGTFRLRRYVYVPREEGEGCLHPLDERLGLVEHHATPALAERVGLLSAEHEQRQVLALLRHDHAVSWSVSTLRLVSAAVRAGVANWLEASQAEYLVAVLQQAQASRGRHRPVLAVGRDGVMVPIIGEKYKEASVGTISVYDRQGNRLATVYLGEMPQEEQRRLDERLTGLLSKVLAAGPNPLPRLVYVSDGGWHPERYYREVLRRMPDPRKPTSRLVWERVLDYYHASAYVHRLAEALFGSTQRGRRWGAKMCVWLRERGQGVTRVLQSAQKYYNERDLRGKRQAAYWSAYGNLRRHGTWMRYVEYRRLGLPIGSGVTEAACKTVFSERLKRSGMQWGREGGQVIVDIRTAVLSKVWDRVWSKYLQDRGAELPQPDSRETKVTVHRKSRRKPATE